MMGRDNMNEKLRIAASGATLAFRNHEKRTYYHEIPENYPDLPSLYAVAMIDGHFPWHKVEPSGDYIIACLEYTTWKDGEGWGWIHLEPDTKIDIGIDLTEWEAVPDQWYYMVVGE